MTGKSPVYDTTQQYFVLKIASHRRRIIAPPEFLKLAEHINSYFTAIRILITASCLVWIKSWWSQEYEGEVGFALGRLVAEI